MRSLGALSSVLLAASLVIASSASARLPISSVSATPAFVSACGIDDAADAARADRFVEVVHEVRAGASVHAISVREEAVDRVAPMRADVEAELRDMIATSRAWLSDDPDALGRLDAARLAWPDVDGTSGALDLRRGCGADLLVDDAWVDKHATTIAVCPGFLLVSASGDASWQDAIAFLLAHEVGHVVIGPTARGRDSERAAEIAADRWASRLLDVRLSRAAPRDRAGIARRALEPVCGPATDSVHPSGSERIAIASESPRVASALAR